MTPDELDAFLLKPHLAIIATVGPDGVPHQTPVWFHYDGESFYVAAIRRSVKVRNLRQNPSVSLCIFTDADRSRYVLAMGTAVLSQEGIPDMVRTMSRNYIGEDGWQEYAERVLRDIPFSLVKFTPTSVVAVHETGD